MYVEIGDHISLQYGGSEAHKKVQSSGVAVVIQGPTTGKVSKRKKQFSRYYIQYILQLIFLYTTQTA